MRNRFRIYSFLLVFFLFVSNGYGYWVWSPTEGRFVSPEATVNAQQTPEELFQSALKLREQNGKVRDVLLLLQQVVKYHHQSAYAPEAQFLIGVIFEEQQKPLRAAAEFKKVVKEYPRSPRIEEAIEHLYKIGNTFLGGEKQKIMGVAIIPVYSKAVDIFKFIVEQAPYGPYGDQAQFKLGTAYRKMSSFTEAANAFQTLIANYPNSSLVDEAHYQLAETSYEFSQNASRDQSTTSQASLHLRDFIRQYSASSLAERAKILKQRLDEQDSEKNYRIGLYYEKQGAMESALIYYEDVAERYPGTEFGKKAAHRLLTIEQPIRAMEKGEAALQQRIAEVKSMLEALEQQEKKGKGKGTPETANTKEQLEQELHSLVIAQKKFSHETHDNFGARKLAFKERSKNLRQKFKAFKSRKKQLMKNPSPELEEVMSKWHASLIAEQEELEREQQTLREFQRGLQKQKLKAPKAEKKKRGWFNWVPHWGKSKQQEQAAQPELRGFNRKQWNHFKEDRAQIVLRRVRNEKELAKIDVQLTSVEQQELDTLKNIPNLDQLLPAPLLKEKGDIVQKKKEWEDSVQSFEDTKKEFQKQFGAGFIKNLGNESYVSKSTAVNGLIASGKDLNHMLTDLEIELNNSSEQWIYEKDTVATMASAFQEGEAAQKQMDQKIADDNTAAGDQAQKSRLLKKRLKYVEREIRSRVDQIQDWKRENAKRMKRLNVLLKPEGQSKSSQAAEKVLAPAKGTYKLTKAFFFGLEDNDQKLMQEADAQVKQGELQNSSSARVAEIRELQEEIELQSILIQGRSSEIQELQVRLADLQKQAEAIPGFSYQTLLVERIPTDLAHSVDNAKKLLGFEGKEADIQNRLHGQNKQLSALEQKIKETQDQIEVVHLAIDQKNNKPEKSKAGIMTSVSGDTESLPEEGNAPAAETDDQNAAQAKLIQMKADINIRAANVQQAESVYHRNLVGWYHSAGQAKLGEKTVNQLKKISGEKAGLEEKKKNIHALQSQLVGEEVVLVETQKKFVDQELNDLEAKLETLNDPSDSAYQALMGEIKSTQELRDSLIRDLTTLQSA